VPHFRSAQPRDAGLLAPKLRKMDALEVSLLHGTISPALVILGGVLLSKHVSTIADDNDEPMAIFGVMPSGDNEQIGLVWLLGTDGLLRHRMELLRKAEGSIQQMLTIYPCLTNVVHEDNVVHRRWLHRFGFRRLGVEYHSGHKFLQFARML